MRQISIFYSTILLSVLHFSFTVEVSMEGAGLYSPSDRITVLNVTNFKTHVVGSQHAWMVEFYSSWCGHCINFAPTFKQLAADVYGWGDIIAVGAIDCAQDINTPICRDYEIMGYPTIKFFPPEAPEKFTGQGLHQRGTMSVDGMKDQMIEYVTELERNNTAFLQSWPNLLPYRSEKLDNLWTESPEFYALLLVDGEGSSIASQVILDIYPLIRKLKIPLQLRSAVQNKKGFLEKFQKDNGILVMNKELSDHTELKVSTYSRAAWYTAIKDYIWEHSKDFAITGRHKEEFSNDLSPSSALGTQNREEKAKNSKKEMINRRYKVFMSDLEKALIYSLSHEVAQHEVVAGESLVALQKYITVLDKYFPGRPVIEIFLKDLHVWIHKHEDAVRGEDLSKWIEKYTGAHGIKINHKWVGCQGSKAQYGGYPCGLWSIWHALTISQGEMKDGDPKLVLHAMQGYIQEFFGCQECARHFDQTIQQGSGIKEHVSSHADAILYLWNVHNKVNQRLSGDISEDPVYPKLIFPTREFCSACYTDMTGYNLWDEFNREEVMNFLKNMYSIRKISKQGLLGDQVGGVESHTLILTAVEDTAEQLDLENYKEPSSGGMNFMFFNGADISLCVLLWASSAILIFLLYLKFVMKRRFSHTALMSVLRRKTSYNPLVGKV